MDGVVLWIDACNMLILCGIMEYMRKNTAFAKKGTEIDAHTVAFKLYYSSISLIIVSKYCMIFNFLYSPEYLGSTA